MTAERGVTLAEVLIASTLALLVVIGIGQVDVTRVRIAEEVRRQSGVVFAGRIPAAIAALQIAQRLEPADRLLLCQDGTSNPTVGTMFAPCVSLSSQPDTDVLFRIPIVGTPQAIDQGSCTSCQGSVTTPPNPCCFDIAANYRWDEFRFDHTTGVLKLYSNVKSGCSNVTNLATYITVFTVQYIDASQPLGALGGSPVGPGLTGALNNNVLTYAVRWEEAINGQTYSQVFPGEVTLRAAGFTNISTGAQNPALGDVNPPPASSCGL